MSSSIIDLVAFTKDYLASIKKISSAHLSDRFQVNWLQLIKAVSHALADSLDKRNQRFDRSRH